MLLSLCLSFLQIGAFAFGGGYAVLAFIQKELIVTQQLITPEVFVNLVAIAQMTPGSMAVNASAAIGYTLCGVPGGILCPIATMAIPFAGIRPLAIGIVAAACLSVAETALTSLSSILFVGVGLLLVTKAKATPIVTVVICGVLGGVVYTLFPVLATI